MRSTLLRIYLRDRAGWLAAFAINTALLLTLTFLVRTRANLGYALLLSATVLVIYLAVDLLRWWPFAAAAYRLCEQATDLDALTALPPASTAEQGFSRDLLAQMHRLALAERLRREDAHRRHLTFVNLWVHQMKTPVSAIRLTAQQAGADAARLEAAAATVLEETDRLAEGLDLVLHMARLDHFAADYHIERVDVAEALRGAINRRRRQFIRVGIFPEIHAGDEEWIVRTDAKWHALVLDQIISNALKYGAQGGPAGQRLRCRLGRTGAGAVTLAISDEGPGIVPEDLPRLFEPFFTGQNGRRYADATGVGLYIVRQVLERLGHTIAIDSAPGAGTTVTITYLTKL
jgi:two-component system, OmpR family, sensor histidine kinase YxdK